MNHGLLLNLDKTKPRFQVGVATSVFMMFLRTGPFGLGESFRRSSDPNAIPWACQHQHQHGTPATDTAPAPKKMKHICIFLHFTTQHICLKSSA